MELLKCQTPMIVTKMMGAMTAIVIVIVTKVRGEMEEWMSERGCYLQQERNSLLISENVISILQIETQLVSCIEDSCISNRSFNKDEVVGGSGSYFYLYLVARISDCFYLYFLLQFYAATQMKC